MNQTKIQISKNQFFIIVTLYIFGNDLIRGIHAQILKQDIWISTIIAPILSVIILSIYFILYKINDNADFSTAIKKTTGKFISAFLFLLYGLYFMFIVFLNLRDIAETIIIFLVPETATFLIGAGFLLVVIYSLYHGIEVFARSAVILFYFVIFIFFFFSLMILLTNRMHFEYILPILENGIIPVIKPTLQSSYGLPFGELFVIFFIYQFVKNKEKNQRFGYFGILFASFILFLITMYNIVILGPEIMILDIRPSLRISKRIDVLLFMQRLDIIVIVVMIILTFVRIAVLLFGAKYLFAETFKVKKEQKISLIMGFLIVMALVFFAKNYIKFLHFRKNIVIPYINLIFEIIIPFLIILIAIVKKLFKIIKSPEPTPS